MSTRFQFTAQGEEAKKAVMGTSKIRNVGDLGKHTEVLCLGKMMTLFGEPIYITEDMEDQYEYILLAKDMQGTEVYLTVYNGPSGAAIGGNAHDEDSKSAADELVELLKGARAADYDWEGVWTDGPCEIKMGIKNGKPYWEEKEIEDDWE